MTPADNDISQIIRILASGDGRVPTHDLADLTAQAAELVDSRDYPDVAAIRAGWVLLAPQDDHGETFWHEASERFVAYGDWNELCEVEGIEPPKIAPGRFVTLTETALGALVAQGESVADYVGPALAAGALCDDRGWYHADAAQDLDAGAIAAYPTAKAFCEDLDIEPVQVTVTPRIDQHFGGKAVWAALSDLDGSDLSLHLTPRPQVAPRPSM